MRDRPLGALKGTKPEDAPARPLWPLTLGALGVVYGDIGTSPIYAFREAGGRRNRRGDRCARHRSWAFSR